MPHPKALSLSLALSLTRSLLPLLSEEHGGYATKVSWSPEDKFLLGIFTYVVVVCVFVVVCCCIVEIVIIVLVIL